MYVGFCNLKKKKRKIIITGHYKHNFKNIFSISHLIFRRPSNFLAKTSVFDTIVRTYQHFAVIFGKKKSFQRSIFVMGLRLPETEDRLMVDGCGEVGRWRRETDFVDRDGPLSQIKRLSHGSISLF